MIRRIDAPPWRPAVGDPRLMAALERGALVCLAVEAVAEASVQVIVLPWPQQIGGCLVFHDSGPTRRLEVSPAALGGAAAAGALYAAECTAGARGEAPFAWPPVDVTAEARAFTA